MWRKDPVLTGWAVMLLGAVTITTALCYWYLTCSRQLQNLQRDVAGINRNRAMLQALGVDCVEYSKHNPAIDPLLLSVGLKTKTGTPAPTHR